MICPKCDAVNKDNARICQNCGIRLSDAAIRPGALKTERRYLAVGTAVAIIMLMVLILLIWSFSCVCSSASCRRPSENDVNENVEGDWSAVESVSGTEVSGGDFISASDIMVEEPAE